MNSEISANLQTIKDAVERIRVRLETPGPSEVLDRDIRSELARRDGCPASLAAGWWQRTLAQIDGLTVHHTLSHSPHATAQHYVNKSGGRPSIPYHIWIAETGEVLYCLDLTEGCWHDHTGHENTHIALGLAGCLHEYRPTAVQLAAAARVTQWALDHPEMQVRLERVRGHCDYIKTDCPGWNAQGWREDFYALLRDL